MSRAASPEAFVEHLGRERAVAILRTDDRDRAARAMEAAVRAGFRLIEFTLTIPGVFDLISGFAESDGVVVGAGTVLSVAQAKEAVTAGASFLVSPVMDEEVVFAGRALGVAVMPGTHTPTEMWRAHKAGAPLVKLFPAPAAGSVAVRSILGPMPFLRIVPTNGVDERNAAAFLDAGAWAVGFTTPLFEPEALARGDYARVEERGRALLRAVEAASRPRDE